MNLNSFKIHTHNIYLFAYYSTLNNENLSTPQPNWLWEKCDDIVAKTLKTRVPFNIKKHLDLENKIEEPWANLNKYFPQTDNYHPIYVQPNHFFLEQNISNLDPERKTSVIYPIELYDSYGFGMKLMFPKNENLRIICNEDIAQFNPDNCLILDPNQENEYFLGQTLLITIKLENKYNLKYRKNQEKLKSIADNYIASLLSEDFRKPPFDRSGILFGSPIFQYGIMRAPKSYRHIIVWFIFDDKTEEKIEQNYQELLDLFLFRAKIIHAYQEIKKNEITSKNISRQIHTEIKDTQKLDGKVSVSDQNKEIDLESLQSLLVKLPKFSVEYAKSLRLIKKYQNILIENTRNYNDKMHEMRSDFSNEDFSFLEFFTSRTCHSFQERVMGAVQFFQLDIDLIDNAIDSVKGQVAIEQAHRERQLQATITGLGIGIAVAGNFASSYEAGSIAENKQEKSKDPHTHPIGLPFSEQPIINLPFHFPHFVVSFTSSIFVGCLVGLIVWKGTLEFFRWRHKE